MTKSKNQVNNLAIKMAIALGSGLLAGTLFIFLREYLVGNGQEGVWNTLNLVLFQDISSNSEALGIFYILGQLFVNALQLVIIPMVFTSIALAMCRITDTKKLGRISYKTVMGFLATSIFALGFAGAIGFIAHQAGVFQVSISNISAQVGSEGRNPLLVILDAVPNNVTGAFTQNGKVLSIVFLAVVTGLIIHKLEGEIVLLKKLLEELNKMITVFLSFVITKFGPAAIFVLITRTFAIYGVEHLKPALAYVGIVTVALLVFLVVGYALFILLATRLNPIPFVRKIAKVALFGFSTSSSASTLPLNTQTTVNELGVKEEVASFILPLGMTINMNGTAIMQVIAAIFIASSAGYEITPGRIITIGLLALIASVGTPAAPGAGAIILFTVLTGMGYQNDAAVLAYSLILAINRPVEMLVTALNVVGDAATAVVVAKSEESFDESIYYQ
ncbi:MAG: dicarboxylate/amino acid:cation symporter [Niameybacter sp.]|uniref:dicarboxylate/amino acid:cation symporter n=1 Tax=Niameybacter sp. TaxID=2033640 RepID=UPI002FCAEAF5